MIINTLKNETWDLEIQKIRLVYLTEIRKLDPQLAEIGNVILYSIAEAVSYDKDKCSREQVKTDHITREFSNGHALWIGRIDQLKQNKSLYQAIDIPAKRFEKLIEKFYDVFISTKFQTRSAL